MNVQSEGPLGSVVEILVAWASELRRASISESPREIRQSATQSMMDA